LLRAVLYTSIKNCSIRDWQRLCGKVLDEIRLKCEVEKGFESGASLSPLTLHTSGAQRRLAGPEVRSEKEKTFDVKNDG